MRCILHQCDEQPGHVPLFVKLFPHNTVKHILLTKLLNFYSIPQLAPLFFNK
jgi:hypothetical protein